MTVKLTWLGHATCQLEYEDKVILIDPWLDNPKFPGDEYKPKKIDVLCITHGHNDHFGNAIELAKKFKPKIPVIHEMSVYLNSKGVEAIGMNFGGTFEYEGIKFSLVPASHSGGYQDGEKMVNMGNPGGYVITFPDGNSFYHAGDTGVTKEMKITSALFSPKIGLFPIGGHYTMDPRGAAYAAKMMGLTHVIPIHWGTFVPPLNGTPDELKSYIKEFECNTDVIELKPGQFHTF